MDEIDHEVHRRWLPEELRVTAALNLTLAEVDDPELRARLRRVIEDAREVSTQRGWDQGVAHVEADEEWIYKLWS